jgi:hypothetical protein
MRPIAWRSFAHIYDTGGMRQTHLRRHANTLKQLLVHVAAFNLSPLIAKYTGKGPLGDLRRTFSFRS